MYRVKWFNTTFQVTRMLDFRDEKKAIEWFNELRNFGSRYVEIYWVPLQPEMFPV